MSLTASGYHSFLNQEILVIFKSSFAIGLLKSYDQFGTIILENTSQYRLRQKQLIQQKSEVLMARGESIVAFGPVKEHFKLDESNLINLILLLDRPRPNLVNLGFCRMD
eukprot:NODE_520_length_7308_cov_0.176862.p7 type:complete len:109 gc:universal NODE_520_length_7308_cov_0.176862:2407-2733(+)